MNFRTRSIVIAAWCVAICFVSLPLEVEAFATRSVELLVADCGTRVARFDGQSGEFLAEHVTGDCMVDVAVGPDQAFYATGLRSDTVYRIDPKLEEGEIEPFIRRSRDAPFDRPTGLTFGPDGNLYLASSNTGDIFRFDGRSGDFIDRFADLQAATPTEPFPEAVKFGPDGNLYVTSFNGTGVRRFDGTTGEFLGVFTTGGNIRTSRQIAFDAAGDLYVASLGSSSILKYDGTTGVFLEIFARAGGVNGIAFGPDGNLYAGSESSGRIFQFDGTTGRFLGTFAGLGNLNFPIGIAFSVTIPEPATGTSLAACLVALAVRRRAKCVG